MASEVDICNVALSCLGDTATVSSINPPEGSAQAEHCSRFYPVARDSLLEMHNWGFATTRALLAPMESNLTEWPFCYASPGDAVRIISVDGGHGMGRQLFSRESLADGTQVIFSNMANASCLYVRYVSDTTRFSPLFIDALAWLLASKLAGPLIKGEAGAAESKRCLSAFAAIFGRATTSDANQQRTRAEHTAPWIAIR